MIERLIRRAPRTMARSLCILPAAVLLALVLAVPAMAREQSASVRAAVAAGETYTARLGSLPGSASLSVHLESDAPVAVFLLDERDYRGFPDLDAPLFEGRGSGEHRFSLRIPEAGDYFLVIDNREGGSGRTFTLAVTASADVDASSGTDTRLEQVHAELDRFEQNLRRLFVFDSLDFRIRRCGTANTFAADDTVYICAELARELMTGADDRDQARDILLFAVFHEFGHVVLRQWDYPFFDNEEVADEFATVLLVLLGEGERARSLVDYFAGLSPEEELARKRDRDDRHPLSVQRARNIGRWLDDPGLARRWQKVLVPHMQTDMLRALARSPNAWTEPALVESELARRREN